jgi:hypothetical protein
MIQASTSTSEVNSRLDSVNIKPYNQQKYQIDIIFNNLQGNTFQLNLASLVSLEIEEDNRYWYKRAALTIRNPDNVFEKKTHTTANSNTYYKFRNDGRDLVYISVKPVQDETIANSSLQIDYDVWGMMYVFSIYNREEITGDTSKQKQLKLYLWEYEYQMLAEANLPWSTNEVLKQKDSNIVPAYATDEQKLVYTGDAIKHLINKGLEKFTTTTFSKEWDVGSSKIFLTSPTSFTAADTLNYLLKKHVSSQIGSDNGADPCILSRTRFTRQWKLISYSNLFSKAVDSKATVGRGYTASAGELQREIINLSNQTGEEENEYVFKLSNTPSTSLKNPYTNYNNPITSTIRNIHYVDMSTVDSMNEMISTPCYSNNLGNKQFNVNFTDNDIENVKKFIEKNYTNKLKLTSKPDTLLTLNKQKTNAMSIRTAYSFSPNRLSQLAESRNLMLMSALYYNATISFTAGGTPIREAGTFFSIESNIGGVNDEFANKILGQWMIYKVVHKFTESDYTNDVLALRMHANDNINIKNDVT